jgi:hypothetical protein
MGSRCIRRYIDLCLESGERERSVVGGEETFIVCCEGQIVGGLPD